MPTTTRPLLAISPSSSSASGVMAASSCALTLSSPIFLPSPLPSLLPKWFRIRTRYPSTRDPMMTTQTQTRTRHPLDQCSTRNPNPSLKPRRIRSPAFAGVRLRRNAGGGGGGGGGKRTRGPTTPLLNWKFEDADLESGSCSSAPESDKGCRKERESAGGERDGVVSARKLAAGIWHVNGGLGFEPNVFDPHSSSFHGNTKNDQRPPILMNYPKNGGLHKLGASAALPDPSREGATKWDPGFYSHLKILEDQQVENNSDVSSLQSELEHARARIIELDTERQSSKKKIDHFVRKLGEEKESWRRREHEKIRAVIDSIKDDLHMERKNRKRMEIVNSKLVNELAEAKLSAKRFLQDYEKERKTRELMEEVCDELAKEIGEDKAEVEALKADSLRIQEEVEEERKMLQMAEVWREERVQMKLVDAKVTLEEKYSQLSKLQAEIEAFLRARSNSNPNEEEKKAAELLREAANSVKVQEVKEFSYEPPPASEDIFSVFEELQPKEEPNERGGETCYGYTNGTLNGCSDKPSKGFANGVTDRNGDIDDDDSGWETVSHAEEQGSSNSIEGSDPSVNGICEESNASVSGTDWDENGDNGKATSEISEVCSVGTRQSRKKGSSIARLWRSSYQNNGENCHRNSFDAANGRLSNGRMSNTTLSSDGKSGEVGLSSPSVGQWSSPDSVNLHISRGMKGCIEWPRGMQKQSLKTKLLEARIESQKIQLRQALKQKI